MLYFVATPIGNLEDITLRALNTLKSVDVIACEDTRKTSILLNHYDIHKRLISYHKNNEFESAKGIIALLEGGKNVAVVSDAGMPVISDPGNILVQKLQEANQEFTIIPGANAALSALVLSGLSAQTFTFVGFLPNQNKARIELLEGLRSAKPTMIFYVAPHDVLETLALCHKIFGARKACLVKEITKVFETAYSFTLGDDLDMELRGEFVLVVEGASGEENPLEGLTLPQQVEFYINSGLSKKEALKTVAKANGVKNIYKVLENS